MPDETSETTETAQPETQPQATTKPDDTGWKLDRNTRVVNGAQHDPEVLNDLIAKIDKNTGIISTMQRDLAIEKALRLYNLTDEDRDLIDAPTPEGINAKAAKLAARIPAATSGDTEQHAAQIEYPKHEFVPKNEWEAAQEMLRRHK